MYGGVSQVMHLLVPAVPVRPGCWSSSRSRSPCCSAAATSASSGWRWSRSRCSRCSPCWPRSCSSRMPRFLLGRLAGGLRFQLPPRASPPPSPSSASPASARPSCSCTLLVRREGLRALHRARATAAPPGRARARGWVRVMHVDILSRWSSTPWPPSPSTCSAPASCTAWGWCPPARDMIPVLSNIYTQTLGGWALGSSTSARSSRSTAPSSPPPPRTRACSPTCAGCSGLFARDDSARRLAYRRRLRGPAHVRARSALFLTARTRR